MDPVTTLAMTGATTIVAAMATSTWQTTRDSVARLFHRSGHAPDAIAVQLDSNAVLVSRAEDGEQARQSLIPMWQYQLVELLSRHPEAEDELRTLVELAQQELPQAQRSWVQTNIARDHSQVFAAQGGNVIVHQGTPDPAPSTPPGPAVHEPPDDTP